MSETTKPALEDMIGAMLEHYTFEEIRESLDAEEVEWRDPSNA